VASPKKSKQEDIKQTSPKGMKTTPAAAKTSSSSPRAKVSKGKVATPKGGKAEEINNGDKLEVTATKQFRKPKEGKHIQEVQVKIGIPRKDLDASNMKQGHFIPIDVEIINHSTRQVLGYKLYLRKVVSTEENSDQKKKKKKLAKKKVLWKSVKEQVYEKEPSKLPLLPHLTHTALRHFKLDWTYEAGKDRGKEPPKEGKWEVAIEVKVKREGIVDASLPVPDITRK